MPRSSEGQLDISDLSEMGGGHEELPHVRGQGQQPRVPGCDSTGTAEKSYPSLRSGVAAGRSYPISEVRGGGREEIPHESGQGQRPGGPRHIQGAVAAREQKGLEKLSHVEGQEGWR